MLLAVSVSPQDSRRVSGTISLVSTDKEYVKRASMILGRQTHVQWVLGQEQRRCLRRNWGDKPARWLHSHVPTFA
jgi:hypothetical protein